MIEWNKVDNCSVAQRRAIYRSYAKQLVKYLTKPEATQFIGILLDAHKRWRADIALNVSQVDSGPDRH